MKSREGLGLIVVDYLQLMTGRARAENRQVEISGDLPRPQGPGPRAEDPGGRRCRLSRGLEHAARQAPVARGPPRSGCVTADTRILRADTGAEVTMGELDARASATSRCGRSTTTSRWSSATMTHVFSSRHRGIFETRLASGRTTAAPTTRSSPIDGWTGSDELAIGLHVAIPRHPGAAGRGAADARVAERSPRRDLQHCFLRPRHQRARSGAPRRRRDGSAAATSWRSPVATTCSDSPTTSACSASSRARRPGRPRTRPSSSGRRSCGRGAGARSASPQAGLRGRRAWDEIVAIEHLWATSRSRPDDPRAAQLRGRRRLRAQHAFALGMAAHAALEAHGPVLFFSPGDGQRSTSPARSCRAEARSTRRDPQRQLQRRRLDEDLRRHRPARRGPDLHRRQPQHHGHGHPGQGPSPASRERRPRRWCHRLPAADDRPARRREPPGEVSEMSRETSRSWPVDSRPGHRLVPAPRGLDTRPDKRPILADLRAKSGPRTGCGHGALPLSGRDLQPGLA